MKKIYFNGDLGVHAACYKIITRDTKDGYGDELAVFVTQKPGDGCSLINSDVGRNKIINQILEQDLNGIELQYIHFYYQWQTKEPNEKYRHCWKFELDPDLKDVPSWKEPESLLLRLWYQLRNKEIVTWRATRNILAGKLEVYSDFENRSLASKEEVEALRQACQ